MTPKPKQKKNYSPSSFHVRRSDKISSCLVPHPPPLFVSSYLLPLPPRTEKIRRGRERGIEGASKVNEEGETTREVRGRRAPCGEGLY